MDEKKSDSPQSDTFKNTDRITNSQFKIIYDVFLPKTTFRKSTWCLPNYRIAVCKPINRLPTHSDVKLLTERYQDSVPLLFAVCSLSSVAFYCFSKVALHYHRCSLLTADRFHMLYPSYYDGVVLPSFYIHATVKELIQDNHCKHYYAI